MDGLRIGPGPEDFIWASGIEDTFVPQTRKGHRALDEYELMGHYVHWREDLRLARDLGVKALRWGVPWYRVEPQPGNFDWRWTDEALAYMVEELGITPIVDLMHYGCPFWMHREFINERYPQAVAEYAAAFARRYSGLVRWYTPLNEPLVNALMCGKRGTWPPYLRGDRGYIRVMVQLALGMVNTVEALKEVDPSSVLVHVEATGLSRAIRDDLTLLAVEEQRRGYLAFDLITGRVTPDHPLFAWLVRSGARPDALADLARRPVSLDVVGLNFYPQWSTHALYVDPKGHLAYRITEQDGAGFKDLIGDYYRRYRAPVMVTETSAFGDDELRTRWLDASIGAVRQLRAQGVPVVGYTWFPMFTMIDWKYRLGKGPIEQYRIELGLYTLSDRIIGPRWEPTRLVERMQHYMKNPVEAVGTLSSPGALRSASRPDKRRDLETIHVMGDAGMRRRPTTTPDGRYAIYYTFDEADAPPSRPDAADEGVEIGKDRHG